MNGKYFLAGLLTLAVLLALTGCVTINFPGAAPAPESEAPPEETHGEEPVDLTIENFRKQMTVLEWPTEAHIGEDITVRIKTGSDEFWAWVRQEAIEAGQPPVEDEYITYDLMLITEGMAKVSDPEFADFGCHFGFVTPDEDHIVAWHELIPSRWMWYPDESPGLLEPGAYKLVLRMEGHSVMVERNIIIRQ